MWWSIAFQNAIDSWILSATMAVESRPIFHFKNHFIKSLSLETCGAKLRLGSGQSFENATLNALGAATNTTALTVGGFGTSIPDVIDASGNITEIKNVVNLSFTNQLQIQAQAAEGSFNLVVSPRTMYISGPLQRAASASGGIRCCGSPRLSHASLPVRLMVVSRISHLSQNPTSVTKTDRREIAAFASLPLGG